MHQKDIMLSPGEYLDEEGPTLYYDGHFYGAFK